MAGHMQHANANGNANANAGSTADNKRTATTSKPASPLGSTTTHLATSHQTSANQNHPKATQATQPSHPLNV